MAGTSEELSPFKLVLILTIFVSVVGADSAMINVGKFVRVSVKPGHAMTSVRQSRSVEECAAMCLSARCCPQSVFCQSQTSSVCYLKMTSESPLQPQPDTSLGYKCFVREKPECPSKLGYRLIRGQCAKLYKVGKRHKEARSQCEEDCGHLYYYKDLTIDAPVIGELPNVQRHSAARYWVGADRGTTSDYQWHDGSPLSDSDPVWTHSYPRNDNKKCVNLLTQPMRLQNYQCDALMHFFCQIDV